MALTTTHAPETKNAQTVGMAQIAIVTDPGVVRTVLGSCIGLLLYHAARKTGALAHIVMAQQAGRTGPPGKFADTAVPWMLQELSAKGAGRAGLTAKITGGAAMFGGSGPIQIGAANLDAVVRLLEEQRIPIVAQHVGGSKGRRVTFDSHTGDVIVEIVGQQPVIL